MYVVPVEQELCQYSCSSRRFINIISLVLALDSAEDQVTSVFQMKLHLQNVKSPIVLSRCLFDSGALCKYSLLAQHVVDRLASQQIQLNISPVSDEVRPFAGSSISCLGLTRITLSVKDVHHVTHTATFDCYIVRFKSFDVIINNQTCRVAFTKFFYNKDNFVIMANPFRHRECEEELHDIYPDPYGNLSAVFTCVEEDLRKLENLNEICAIPGFEELVEEKLSLLLAASTHTSEMVSQVRLLLLSSREIFTMSNIGIKGIIIDITTSESLPPEIIAKVRPVRRDLVDLVTAELTSYTALGLHVLSESPYAAPIVPVLKPDGSVRIAIDYSVGINLYLTMPSIPIPIIRDIITNLSQYRFYFEIDLAKAYRQLVLSERSSNLLSYVTHMGQYRPITLPEGVRTAPQLFSQAMYTLLRTKYKFRSEVEYYFDNIYGGANSVEELIVVFTSVIKMCVTENIKLKLEKCTFCSEKLKVLGYIVSHNSVAVDPARVESLVKLRPPVSKAELRSILGSFLLCSYFVPNYAQQVGPLYELLRDNVEFVWSPSQSTVFEQVKVALTQAIALSYPDYSKEWVIRTDGSKLGIGGCLVQLIPQEDGSMEEEIIALLSHKLSEVATRWSIYEIELYALIYCIKSWSSLLYGKSFTAQVDHRNLHFLQKSPLAKVNRWRLFLSEFDFVLQIIPGKSNIVADMLSRILEEGQEEENLGIVWTILSEEYLQSKHKGIGEVSHYPVYRLYELVSKDLIDNKEKVDTKELLRLIRNTVDSCGFCNKEKSKIKHEVRKYKSLMVDDAYSMVGIDLVGPFTADIYGYTYVMVIRDFFDRLVQLSPIVGKDSSSYLTALLTYSATFNMPKYVRTDNGKEFTNNLVKEFNKLMNISQSYTVSYTPTGNSMTERINAEFVPQLRMFVQHQNITATWSTYLPIVQCNVNNSFNRVIGMSPFRLRFGERADIYPKVTDVEISGEISDNYVKTISHRIGILKQIAIIISDAELEYLLSRNPDFTQNLAVGDKVLVQQYNNFTQSAPSKLEPRLKGPYEIIEVVDGNLYVCRHMATNKESTIDVQYLRKYPEVTEEEAIASAKFDTVDINNFRILEHRSSAQSSIDELNKLTYEFKIEFLDAITNEPLPLITQRWVGFTFVVGNKVFKSYCQANGLQFMLIAEPKLTEAQKKKIKEKMLLDKFGTDLTSLHYNDSERIIQEDVIQDLIDQEELKELDHTTPEESPILQDVETAPKKSKVKRRSKNKSSEPDLEKTIHEEQLNVENQQVRRSTRTHKSNRKYG